MKALLLTLIGFAFSLTVVCGMAAAASSPPSNNDVKLLADWLAAQQYTNSALPGFGGIREGQGIAATGTNGAKYCNVSPYSANLAILGLLQSRAAQGVSVAERWITWYFNHLDPQNAPDGVPCNHFYLTNGAGETTCVKAGDPFLCDYNDATDSAAATFFSVLWAAYQSGMPAAELITSERRAKVAGLAAVLMRLRQPDGLFWAKADYRVKYLEDNCEVFAGLNALANLDGSVFGDVKHAAFYRNAAERVQRGILSELYDKQTGFFRIARFENDASPSLNLSHWYPDTQAQLWPVIFGVLAPSDPRAQTVAAAVNDHWNGRACPNWAADPKNVNQGWVEAGHAYGALLMGDTNRVRVYLAAVKTYKFQIARGKTGFSWPFSVDDAGWLLRIMASDRF